MQSLREYGRHAGESWFGCESNDIGVTSENSSENESDHLLLCGAFGFVNSLADSLPRNVAILISILWGCLSLEGYNMIQEKFHIHLHNWSSANLYSFIVGQWLVIDVTHLVIYFLTLLTWNIFLNFHKYIFVQNSFDLNYPGKFSQNPIIFKTFLSFWKYFLVNVQNFDYFWELIFPF